MCSRLTRTVAELAITWCLACVGTACSPSPSEGRTQESRVLEPFLAIKKGMSRAEVSNLAGRVPDYSGGFGIANDNYELSDGSYVQIAWLYGEVVDVQHVLEGVERKLIK